MLLVVEDPEDSTAVAALVRAALPDMGVSRVWTGFQALTAVQRRPLAFGLVVLDLPGSSETLDLIRRIQDLAPGMPAILMNNRGPGAIFVARRSRARHEETFRDVAILRLCHDLRGRSLPGPSRRPRGTASGRSA